MLNISYQNIKLCLLQYEETNALVDVYKTLQLINILILILQIILDSLELLVEYVLTLLLIQYKK